MMIEHIEAAYLQSGAYIPFPQGWDWLHSSHYTQDNVRVVLRSRKGYVQTVGQFDRLAVDAGKSECGEEE